MPLPSLQCPLCSAPLTATEVLESCSVSLGGNGLLRLSCPRCGATALARMTDGRLEVGAPAPEAGGAFRATAAVAVPELFVRVDGAWVDCWHRAVYRRFPVVA